jgi:hypothetical protein
MPAGAGVRGVISTLSNLTTIVVGVVSLGALGAFAAIAVALKHDSVRAWILAAVAGGLVVLVLVAYFVGRGRRAGRQDQVPDAPQGSVAADFAQRELVSRVAVRTWRSRAETAERELGRTRRLVADLAKRLQRRQNQVRALEEEVEVASLHIGHVRDFGSQLVELFAVSQGPEAAERLGLLRELIFDAVVQTVHAGRGDLVRCAYFIPVEEGGRVKLRVKHHRGHSGRVEHLRLAADGTSVAGRAFVLGEAQHVPDAEGSAQLQATTGGRPIRSLLCVPVPGARASTPQGVFSVASDRVGAFTRADRDFVQACASLVALLEVLAQIIEEATDGEE